VVTLARGGRRQGQPGKSYANRKDLNVVRADQPGSSATPPPQPEQPRQRILPDAIPNLNSPTAQPDIPIEVGVRAADPMMFGTPGSYDSSLLLAALQADPDNPDLNRLRDRMLLKGEL